MSFLSSLVLPAVVVGLSAPLVMVLRRLGLVGVKTLASLRDDAEANTIAKTAAMVGQRLIATIDGVIDDAAVAVNGTFAKMQRPESPGGMEITADEWRQIRTELAEQALRGFGTEWTIRLLGMITGQGEPQSRASVDIAQAHLMRHVERAVESRYAERVDMALANGSRTAPPLRFGPEGSSRPLPHSAQDLSD